MDYFGILKDSIRFAFKHKILWIFGFIIMLSQGISLDWNEQTQTRNSNQTLTSLQIIIERVREYSALPNFNIFLIGLGLLILFLSLLFWVSNALSKIALILSQKEEKDSYSFKSLLNQSIPYLKRVLGYDLIWIGIFLVTLLPLIPLLLFSFFAFNPFFIVSPLLILLSCFGMPLLILLFAFYFFLNLTGYRLIVLDNSDSINAVKSSWLLF